MALSELCIRYGVTEVEQAEIAGQIEDEYPTLPAKYKRALLEDECRGRLAERRVRIHDAEQYMEDDAIEQDLEAWSSDA